MTSCGQRRRSNVGWSRRLVNGHKKTAHSTRHTRGTLRRKSSSITDIDPLPTISAREMSTHAHLTIRKSNWWENERRRGRIGRLYVRCRHTRRVWHTMSLYRRLIVAMVGRRRLGRHVDNSVRHTRMWVGWIHGERIRIRGTHRAVTCHRSAICRVRVMMSVEGRGMRLNGGRTSRCIVTSPGGGSGAWVIWSG